MHSLLRLSAALAVVTGAGWLAGCSTPPRSAAEVEAPAPVIAAPAPAASAPAVVAPAPAEPAFTGKVSLATSERDYRRDGAQHLYERYGERVYRGKLPPLLQAVGVMRVTIGPRGELQRFEWMRAPDHVPHVKAEIERMVLAAAPFPAPKRLGSVVYTDSWLWDKSGRFQLDTLTEGQLDRLPASVTPPAAKPPAARVRQTALPRAAKQNVAQGEASPEAAQSAAR